MEQVRSFNTREEMFRLQVSTYEDLNQLHRDFQIYYALWTEALDFDFERSDWQTGSFIKQSFPEIDTKVRAHQKQVNGLIKAFSDAGDDNAVEMARKLKSQVDEFKEK